MKLAHRILILAVLLTLPRLHAADPAPKKTADKPGAAATPAKPLTPDQIEKSKLHTLVIMEVKTGNAKEKVLIDLFTEDAPATCDNFINNVKNGVYKGLAFHRAIKDYLVQTGDPKSRDQNARDQWGLSQERTIPAEIKMPHVIGSLAMARRNDKVNPNRDSDGNQFYITLGDMSALNGAYTVFGQVVSGVEELKRISELPVDGNDCPLARIEISDMTITKQRGQLTQTVNVGKKKRQTKPDALKSSFELFIERIW